MVIINSCNSYYELRILIDFILINARTSLTFILLLLSIDFSLKLTRLSYQYPDPMKIIPLILNCFNLSTLLVALALLDVVISLYYTIISILNISHAKLLRV